MRVLVVSGVVDVFADTLPPPASILICTKDRPELLQRCLDAILAGSCRPEEILVVDQSEDDRTRHVVEATRADAAPTTLSHIRSRGGMARGQNAGFARLRSPVVLVTDDDCAPDPDWVAAACAAFSADPALALVTGRVLPLGPEAPGRVAVASRTSTVPLELDATVMPWDVGSGNNFGVRLSEVRRLHGNDERLGPGARFRGGADMDLFRRVLRDGAIGRYDPSVVVRHERATPAERRRRRIPYGYGMGVGCALWWRQGDRDAARIARRWVGMRVRRAVRAARARRGALVWEEVLVLTGTARGIVRGSIVRPADPLQGGS